MSIDELSAAIDAHMTEISKSKSKKKSTPKTSVESEPTPASSEKQESKDESNEEATDDEGQTKINVKHAYVTKKSQKSSASLPKEEKSQITHTSNVELKPISKTEKEESKTGGGANKSTVDVVVKTPSKVKMSRAEPTEETQEGASEPPEIVQETAGETTEVAEEELREKQKPDETPLETVEKPVIKTETPEPTPVVRRGNSTDELDAQIPVTKPREDTETYEGEKLKTFDTKQYHIPIKASHHHRRGGSFKVFIAVMAVILATIYVLSELDIIDLASLVAN